MSAQRFQIVKCEVCGIVAEVLVDGAGELVCCGRPMTVLAAKTADLGKEKHVPVIRRTDAGYAVSVGEVAHPMEPKHFIQWIELIVDGQLHRQFLSDGDKPEAVFAVAAGNKVTAREMCNIHGLWSATL